MAGIFEIKKSKNGQFMFNLKAGNGQIILTSELYQEKASAQNGIESVKKNAAITAHFEERSTSNKEPYFVLKAANGQIIGKSETYSSAAAMKNGIVSVQNNAPEAKIVDLTEKE